MWGLLASMQMELISYPLLTFGEMVDKTRRLEELDGREMTECNKKAKTESHVSGFGESSVSQPCRGGLTWRRARVSSL